jgi:predicted nucleotidyltransferase
MGRGGIVDVSLPLRSVIPSLDGPVLAALASTNSPAGLSEVRRLTGGRGSAAGIRKVLLRLVDSGIVDVVPGGYVLNREHVAAPAIEQLATLHGELADRIRGVLQEWDGDVLLGGMFGSAARRDGDERSDIDLLIVSDSPGLDELVDSLAERVRRWTGNDAQVVAKTVSDIRRLQDVGKPILQHWHRDLIVLEGDRRLLRTAVAA